MLLETNCSNVEPVVLWYQIIQWNGSWMLRSYMNWTFCYLTP